MPRRVRISLSDKDDDADTPSADTPSTNNADTNNNSNSNNNDDNKNNNDDANEDSGGSSPTTTTSTSTTATTRPTNMPMMSSVTTSVARVVDLVADMCAEDGEERVVVRPPSLDLDMYISAYAGNARIYRLMFIASHCPPLQLEAYKLAMALVEGSPNTELVRVISRRWNEARQEAKLNVDPLDEGRMLQAVRENAKRREGLLLEQRSNLTNKLAEPIRVSCEMLGNFFYSIGDLEECYAYYAKLKEHSNNSEEHIINAAMHLAEVSLELRRYIDVQFHARTVESILQRKQTITMEDKASHARCLLALTHLRQGNFRDAAQQFVDLNIAKLPAGLNATLSHQDIGTYGALCSLSSFSRAELKSRVLDNSLFRQFLELVPPIRDLVLDFYGSRYASYLANMARLRSDLLLDIYMREHVKKIDSMIRQKAIIQYCSTFKLLDLRKMATAFGSTVDVIEPELEVLIHQGSVLGRIDSHQKVLHANESDLRASAYMAALEVGDKYTNESKFEVLRLSMLRHDFVIKRPKAPAVTGAGHGHGSSRGSSRGGSYEPSYGSGYGSGYGLGYYGSGRGPSHGHGSGSSSSGHSGLGWHGSTFH